MNQYRKLPLTELGISVQSLDGRPGVLSVWHVTTQGDRGEIHQAIFPLGVDEDGQRHPTWERPLDRIFQQPPATGGGPLPPGLLKEEIEPMVRRKCSTVASLSENRGYDAKLIAWVELH